MTSTQFQLGQIRQKGRFAIVEIPNVSKEVFVEQSLNGKKRQKPKRRLINYFQRNITEEESQQFDLQCEVFDQVNKKWIDLYSAIIPKNSVKVKPMLREENYPIDINFCEYSAIMVQHEEHYTDHWNLTDDNKKINDHELKIKLDNHNLVNPLNNITNFVVQPTAPTIAITVNSVNTFKDQILIQSHFSKICEKDTTLDSLSRSHFNNNIPNSNYKSHIECSTNSLAKPCLGLLTCSKSKEYLGIDLNFLVAQCPQSSDNIINQCAYERMLKDPLCKSLTNEFKNNSNNLPLIIKELESEPNISITKEPINLTENRIKSHQNEFFEELIVSPKYRTSSGDTFDFNNINLSINNYDEDFEVFEYLNLKEREKDANSSKVKEKLEPETRINPRTDSEKFDKEKISDKGKTTKRVRTRIHSDYHHNFSAINNKKRSKLKTSRVESFTFYKEINDNINSSLNYNFQVEKQVSFIVQSIVRNKCNE